MTRIFEIINSIIYLKISTNVFVVEVWYATLIDDHTSSSIPICTYVCMLFSKFVDYHFCYLTTILSFSKLNACIRSKQNLHFAPFFFCKFTSPTFVLFTNYSCTFPSSLSIVIKHCLWITFCELPSFSQTSLNK